jgi:predicted dehydrogenase
MTAREPLRIGILGASRVAVYALVEPARRSRRARAAAVAARDLDRARRFAVDHGVARVLPDYEALVRDPEIDAVYVGLPAALHCEWTLRALAEGKHVLCEKPFASNAGEAERMVAEADARGLALLEAFHWRFHPLARRLREIVTSDEIGAVREIDAGFTVGIGDAGDIRYDLALGGGALMDLGCYAVQWARFAAGAEPEVTRADAVEGPAGIDVAMTAELAFPGGAKGRVHCSMEASAPLRRWLRVRGDAGELHVDNPLAPHRGHSLEVHRAGSVRAEQVAGASTYDHQLEGFVAAARDGATAPTGGADAIATMRVIDAIYRRAGLAPRGVVSSAG